MFFKSTLISFVAAPILFEQEQDRSLALITLASTPNNNQCVSSTEHFFASQQQEEELRLNPTLTTRSIFLQTGLASVGSLLFVAQTSLAFEGGVGGLGKTKPTTGVILFNENSTPIQNEKGIVSAEIKSVSGKPILVEFQTPWPLLPTTSGLEARDLRSSESAFVQLVPTIPNWQNRKVFQELLITSALASQGKYGAYGAPTDIKVKPYNSDTGIYAVSFTSYTPSMRESERQVWVKPVEVDSSLVMLITGTTKNAFASRERIFAQICDSFLAVAAPETRLRAK